MNPPLSTSPDLAAAVPAEISASIEAFAHRLDTSDPILVGFNLTPMAMAVSDPTLPDNPVVYVNAAFEALTGFTSAEILGRNCRFLQGALTAPEDIERLRGAIRTCTPIQLDLLNHRRDGEPFWNRLMVAPVFDSGGELRYFVASQLDVTIERHRVRVLEEDRDSLAAEIAQRDVDLARHNARMRMALKAGSLGTWTLDLPEQSLTASSSCKRVFGRAISEPFTYEELLASIHPDDLPMMRAAVATTIERGTPYTVEYRILTPGGEQRWVAVQGEVQYQIDGQPLAMMGFSTDISARKFAEEHRSILARELTHRVKNTLATVNAVVSQTLRDATSLEDAAAAVGGRIASLAAAHDLLVRDEIEGAAIGDIVERVLLPFTDRGGARFDIAGPTVRLSPEITLALSMALHELATNAVKYGALSVAAGRVAINLSIKGSGDDRRLAVRWREHNGPLVAPPTRTGFGSRMIERVLRKHLREPAEILYSPEGLRFSVEVPV